MKKARFALLCTLCLVTSSASPSAHANSTCQQIFAKRFDVSAFLRTAAVTRSTAIRQQLLALRIGRVNQALVSVRAERPVGPTKFDGSIRTLPYDRWSVDAELIRVMDPDRLIQSESLSSGYTRYYIETPSGRLEVLPHTFEYMSAMAAAIRKAMQKPQWISSGITFTDEDARLWFKTVLEFVESTAQKVVTPNWARYAMNSRVSKEKAKPHTQVQDRLLREWLEAHSEPDDFLKTELSLDVAESILGHERLMLLFHQTMAQFWARFFDPANKSYTLRSPDSDWQVLLPIDLDRLNSLSGYVLRSRSLRRLEHESGFADYTKGWMDGSDRRVDRDLLLRIANSELQTTRRSDFIQLLGLSHLNAKTGEVDRLNADGLRYPLRSKFSAELTARGYPPKMVDAMLRGYGFF